VSGEGCRLPPEADRVLILVNPTAGRGSAAALVDPLVGLLRRRCLNVELSSDLDEACHRANQIHAAGLLRALIGVGGDGTVAQLVNRTAPGLPICVCPAGTSNLLARHFGLSADPARLCDCIADGSLLKMDAGLANGRIFLLMASCGFDAHVVAEVHRRRQQVGAGRFSYWSYVKPILDAIRSYQYPAIRVYWNHVVADPETEAPSPGAVRWVFAFNLPLYGWGLLLAYWADATDGLLDVCTFRHGSLGHGLRYLAAAQFGWLRRLPDCAVARATKLRITAEQPVPYQLDGDPGGWLPLEIDVLPKRLTLVVPRRAFACLRIL